ncbi:MAG: PDDEXK nuclease domain-containing protein [Clostridiales Family XIII bacterium]|jgi:predicted nuclease of restriction endonuclease-like (RecB) superfamily|nr:PDDEXK nuclease domain-containing protein [Clostridiales Family XIII bacterium]
MAAPNESTENRFFADISAILREGRNKAHVAVNFAMVETYWKMGKLIVEQEQQGYERANYGEHLLVNLSRHLSGTFGKGFSVANLWNFRQFYLTYPQEEILYTVCRELSWSHIRLIMRLDSQKARDYYLNEARTQNWSVRALERNIKSGYFERLLSSQNSEFPASELTNGISMDDLIKDPYVLEFLGLPENVAGKESRLESAIIGHLQEFLLEMGKGFSFVGRQLRISTETSHFYVDVVFYNYLLKCFVIIDLKTQKLTHQDIGQMDMYVRMFDDLKRGVDDNPTIGLILCADKDETIVKYSVLRESRQIFASKYKTILPSEEELTAELERNTRFLREVRDTAIRKNDE